MSQITPNKLSFNRIGLNWYLKIIPKYLFTDDGETPCGGDLAGPYTTSLKAKERNYAVLNHILFWSDVLAGRKPTIELTLGSRSLVVIEREPVTATAKFAIPFDPAIFEEEDTSQLDFFVLLNETEDEVEDDEY